MNYEINIRKKYELQPIIFLMDLDLLSLSNYRNCALTISSIAGNILSAPEVSLLSFMAVRVSSTGVLFQPFIHTNKHKKTISLSNYRNSTLSFSSIPGNILSAREVLFRLFLAVLVYSIGLIFPNFDSYL